MAKEAMAEWFFIELPTFRQHLDSGHLLTLQLIAGWQTAAPLEKVATLEGVLYGILLCGGPSPSQIPPSPNPQGFPNSEPAILILRQSQRAAPSDSL